MRKILKEKPSALFIAIGAGILVVAIAVCVAAAISSKSKEKSTLNGNELSAASANQTFSLQAETDSLTDESHTDESESSPSISAASTRTQGKNKNSSVKAASFKELNLNGEEIGRLKRLTYKCDSMYEDELKGNHLPTFFLKDYILESADYYGLKKNPDWYAAPKVFDGYLSGTNQKCFGALSIDDFNRIIRDIYGDKAVSFTYKDFPDFLELNSTWKIWHAQGGTYDSTKCGECLVLIDYATVYEAPAEYRSSGFEENTYIGFRVENGRIEAIAIEYCEFDNQKLFMHIAEVTFVKNGSSYCLSTVNEDCRNGGDTPIHPLSHYKGYTFYSYLGTSSVEVNLEQKYGIAPPKENQKPKKADSVESAYEAFVKNKTWDLFNPRYALIDIDQDGTQELFVTGQESEDSRFCFTYLYTCTGNDYKVIEVDSIYSYHEPQYNKKEALLLYSPEGSSGGEGYSKFFRKVGNTLVEEYEIYYRIDKNNNTVYYRREYDANGALKTEELLGHECTYYDNATLIETKEIH